MAGNVKAGRRYETLMIFCQNKAGAFFHLAQGYRFNSCGFLPVIATIHSFFSPFHAPPPTIDCTCTYQPLPRQLLLIH